MPEEGEILVPPPPSIAPPPPPGTFILPPPDFMGKLTEPVYMTPSMVEEDFSLLKPPPMAPPKAPSVCSSGSTSSLPVSGPPDTVPEPPKFAPPQPPSERQTKTSKTPPPKPIRLSSMTNLIDSPPQTPAPPPPVQTPTLSTFNPQNTAKIYDIPKTSILSKYENHEQRPKQILLLEDSGSVKPAPVPAQVDGKGPKTVPQPKPVPKDVQELKDHLDISNHSPLPLPEPKKELKTATFLSSLENGKPLWTLTQTSPQPQKAENSPGVILEPSKDKPEKSPSQGHRFSPLLERKLRNLKIGENNAPQEGHAASPLALLMAAKERDKHRSNHYLSQENSYTKNEQSRASIHPSDSSPNSFTVTPRSSSSLSLTPANILQESKSANIVTPSQIQTSPQSASPALAKDQMLPSILTRMAKSQSTTNLVIQPQSTQHEDDKEDLNIPFIPPPPEFDDLDEVVEPPPSILPPDPPTKKAATQNISFFSPAPPPSPKPKPPQLPKPPPPQAPKLPPPEAPKLPPPEAPKLLPPEAPRLPTPVSKPKPQVQTKPKVASNQLPSALSSSQATLLSILQKKMLEMDHKMSSVKETESSSDDWGTPSSEENNKVPVVPRATPLSKNDPVVNKAAALHMKELEGKMAKRFQETSSVKVPTR